MASSLEVLSEVADIVSSTTKSDLLVKNMEKTDPEGIHCEIFHKFPSPAPAPRKESQGYPGEVETDWDKSESNYGERSDSSRDTPLDLTLEGSGKKRKWLVQGDLPFQGTARITREMGDSEDSFISAAKRKRPTVISFAMPNFFPELAGDVDAHFKKSLGMAYNRIFVNEKQRKNVPGAGKKISSRVCSSQACPGAPSPTPLNRGKRPVKQAPRWEQPSSTNSVVKNISENTEKAVSTIWDETVDDHFKRALGDSTWKKLQSR